MIRRGLRTALPLLLLSACMTGAPAAGASPSACGEPEDFQPLDPQALDVTALVGSYTLTVVTQWSRRTDSLVHGHMELALDSLPLPSAIAPPLAPNMQRVAEPAYGRPSLIGWTQADVRAVHVQTTADPASQVPRHPGIRLIGSALRFGACSEGAFCEDGLRTDLVITEVRAHGFAGRWRAQPDMFVPGGVQEAGWPFGYFCAERTR